MRSLGYNKATAYLQIFRGHSAPIALLLAFAMFIAPTMAGAQNKLQLPIVASGFKKPVAMAFIPGSSDEFFVAEEVGLVYKVTIGSKTVKQQVLDVAADELDTDAVRVLNVIPHPKVATNRQLIVSYRLSFETGCFFLLSKFIIPENPENETEERELLRIKQPCNGEAPGGGLSFGEPNILYVGVGVGRPSTGEGPAQQASKLLGKILRIDIESDEPYAIPPDNPFASNNRGQPEIWALGFQNPHRITYDPVTKEILASDRGKGFFDEVNIVTAAGNYGWGVFEGSECQLMRFECMGKRFRGPMFQNALSKKRAMVGGVVYRGTAYPSLIGRYLFAEFPAGRLWAVQYKDGRASGKRLRWGTNLEVSDIAANGKGEVFLVAQKKGEIRRVALN